MVWDSPSKGGVIPDGLKAVHAELSKALVPQEGVAAYQLVGVVTAHQGDDG